MKILFLSSRNPYPVVDGHTNRTYNILKGLAKYNQVYLLAMSQTEDESNPKNIDNLKQFCQEVEIIPSPPKNLSMPMIYRLMRSLFSLQPYTIWRHYSRKFKNRIKELALSNHFDIVHFDVLPLVVYRKCIKNYTCSITDHDVCFIKTKRMYRTTGNLLLKLFLFLEYMKLFLYEKSLFEKFDLGFAVSGIDAKILKEISGCKEIVVIPNGVDILKFVASKGYEEEDSILWVGGMSYYPNREAVIYFLHDIFPMIKRKVPECQFKIAGNFMKIKDSIIDSNYEGVEILGFVPDIRPSIRKCKVFVAPILSGSGTRLKILEAMASGKAIVTTSIGCEGIEGKDKRHFLIADSAEDFADKVVELLLNPPLRMMLGNNARRLVEKKYDWKKINEKLDSIYRSATCVSVV